MTKKLAFEQNNKNNLYSKTPLNKKSIAKNPSFQSTKNFKNFNYHQRLPFKLANIELKYIRNVIAFVGITVTLLLILQNLTAYSSNFDPKIQTVRLITNFNQNQQTNESSQKNIIQEFEFGTSIRSENSTTNENDLDKNKNLSTKKSENIKSSKNNKKSSEQSSQKIRIKKNQKSENNSQNSNISNTNILQSQQENSAQKSDNSEEK